MAVKRAVSRWRWPTAGLLIFAGMSGGALGYGVAVSPGKGVEVAAAEQAALALTRARGHRALPDGREAALIAEIDELRYTIRRLQDDLWVAETEVGALKSQITDGYVTHKTVRIDEPYTAYSLLEPKLMISVDDLPGGAVLAHFGLRTERFAVGERLDFVEGTCNCFLLLMASVRDRAEFLFGCEPADIPETAQEDARARVVAQR